MSQSMSTWYHAFHLPIFLVALAGVPIDLQIDSVRAAQTLPVHIRWTFGAVRAEKEGYRFMSVHKDTHLQSGDYFKFTLELMQPVHVYLIHQNPQGRVTPLLVHSQQPRNRPKDQSDPLRLSLPEPDKTWLRFDDQTGVERFYLIASATRLETLEALLNTLTQNRPEQRAEVEKRVLASTASADTLTGKVTRVIDGDTLEFLDGTSQKPVKMRLYGIDTPKQGHPFGTQAKKALSELVFGRVVTVTDKGQDS
jgi:hypothetical protein